MAKDNRNQEKKEQKISAILPTNDQLTGRAGLGGQHRCRIFL